MRPRLVLALLTLVASASAADLQVLRLDSGESLRAALNLTGDSWVVAIDGGLVQTLDSVAELRAGSYQLFVAELRPGGMESPAWWLLEVQSGGVVDPVRPQLRVDRTSPTASFSVVGAQRVRNGITVIAPGSELLPQVEDASDVAHYQVLLDQQPWQGALTDLSDGQHRASVSAIDRAGNAGESDHFDFIVDAVGPTIAWRIDGRRWPGSEASALFSPPVSVSLSLNDEHSDKLELAVRQDGRWVVWDASKPVVTDRDMLMIRGRDEFGNQTEKKLHWHYDRQGPALDLKLPQSVEHRSDSIYLTQGDYVSFDVRDRSGLARAEYRYNRKPWLPLPERLRLVDAGTYRLTVRAVDQAGNENTEAWVLRTQHVDRRHRRRR